jgi:DNA-binding IclR family transcriptional regulator
MPQEKAVNRGPEGLRAIERAVTILRALATRPTGMTLADVVRETGFPMTSVHRTLAVLRRVGLVRETPEGLHALGVTTVVLSGAFLEGLDLRTEARPVMRRLVEETGETCHLGVLAAAYIVYIEKFDSPHPVRMVSRVGGLNPAVTTAIGRAILAHSPDVVVESTIQASKELTGQVVDRDRLYRFLEEVRTAGFSMDLEDTEPGICCVGAPVFDYGNLVTGGVSISIPAARFDHNRIQALGDQIRERADQVSRALGWAGSGSAGE